MVTTDAASTLARLGTALVSDHDAAGVLGEVVHRSPGIFGADACALMVEQDGTLELLAASSHAADDLELHQAHLNQGPCFDSWRTREPVQVVGAADLGRRWPDLSPVMVRLGFHAVLALPLRHRGGTFGALGLFWRDEVSPGADARQVAQGLADLVALTVATATPLGDGELHARLDALLAGRVVVEQAKGALAERLGVDPAEAYQELIERSGSSGRVLADVASQVLDEVRRDR